MLYNKIPLRKKGRKEEEECSLLMFGPGLCGYLTTRTSLACWHTGHYKLYCFIQIKSAQLKPDETVKWFLMEISSERDQ